jgi:hypothetical protein
LYCFFVYLDLGLLLTKLLGIDHHEICSNHV